MKYMFIYLLQVGDACLDTWIIKMQAYGVIYMYMAQIKLYRPHGLDKISSYVQCTRIQTASSTASCDYGF